VASDSEGWIPTIALDTLDNPHILAIAYRTDASPRPVYGLVLYSRIDGSWVVDTVEKNGEEPMPYNGDLAIDRSNRVWAIYRIGSGFDAALVVARKDSAGWAKDTVSIGACAYFEYSIAVDPSGIAHIALEDTVSSGNPCGFYAYYDTIWHEELVDSETFYGAYWCSIDADQSGKPHISYFHYCSFYWYELSHAFKENGIWYREGIDSIGDLPWKTTSIRLNRHGIPTIVYTDEVTYQPRCAYYDEENCCWRIDTVDVFGMIESQKALDVDSLGRPHFIYHRNWRSWYAYKTDSGWCREMLPITPTTTKGLGGSLRIGKDGTIHIAQFATNDDYSHREIHYIYGIPEGVEEGKGLQVEGERVKLMVSPNIIRDNARIQYTIPEKQCVSLILYDITGRKVATIAEGVFESGVYSYNFDSSNLSAGVYFLVLKGKKDTVAQKVLILK